MRAIRYELLGGPEVLEFVEFPTPRPGTGEVLVQVEAAGVNVSDIGRRLGRYLDATPLPFKPGSEIVGRVCALGAGIAALSVGNRVAGVTASRSGGYAEYCTIAADLVTRIYDGRDARRAVAVPNQGATALHVLETMARLKQGGVVAVTATAGGVGGLADQLARHLGAGAVVAFASSARKLEHARGLGADVTVDVTSAGLADQLRDATKGRGFDGVLDSVGGELASLLFVALAPFGCLVSFSVTSGAPLSVASHAMVKRSVSMSGFHLDAVMAVPGRFSATLARLYELGASGALTPHVGLEVPLEGAADAHAALESRTTMGKIVLSVGGFAGNEDGAARHERAGRTV